MLLGQASAPLTSQLLSQKVDACWRVEDKGRAAEQQHKGVVHCLHRSGHPPHSANSAGCREQSGKLEVPHLEEILYLIRVHQEVAGR